MFCYISTFWISNVLLIWEMDKARARKCSELIQPDHVQLPYGIDIGKMMVQPFVIFNQLAVWSSCCLAAICFNQKLFGLIFATRTR